MLAHNGIIIVFTLLLAVIVTIMPMPLGIDSFRPDWLLVVVIYWAIALPNKVNVITAGIMGFILDVLLGSTLGVHCAAMAVTTYIAVMNYQKIRNFSYIQQALIIGVLSALYHLLVFWQQRFLNDSVFLVSYLFPVFTTMIVWPWAFLLLRKVRRRFKIK